jgi:hypothetical protein
MVELDNGGSGSDEPRRPGNFQGVGDTGDSGSLQELGIGWILTLRPLAERISRFGLVGAIIGIVAAWFINGMLNVWAALLGSIEAITSAIASLPQIAFLDPVTAAASPVTGALAGFWVDYTAWAMDAAAGFGPAAPFAVLLLLTPPIAATGFVFQLVLGLLDTWLPISELPYIGWLVQ